MVSVNVKIIDELKTFLDIVSEDPSIRILFTNHSSDFSRERKLPLKKIVGILINLPKRSLSIEIQEFFDALQQSEQSCSKGAFSLQRVKLQPEFFQLWNKWLVDLYYHYYGSHLKLWKGFRLLAVDGSIFYLINKKEVIEYFGTQENQYCNVPMSRVMQIHDVLNDITIWGDIYPLKNGEQTIMYQQVDKLPLNSVTLFDRGFPSYTLLFLMNNQESQRHFVMRCKAGFNNESNVFAKSKKNSKTLFLYPGNDAIVQLKVHGYIVNKQTSVKVRMVKVRLSTGETEILLTNLFDEKKYTRQSLKELYAMRWQIETTYSKQKNQMQMEIFSGHRVICIKQDFAAALFVANLQSLIEKQCEQHIQQLNQKRVYNYKINRNVSWAALKHSIVKLFLENDSDYILRNLQSRFQQNTEPIRPDRHYKRIVKIRKTKGKYHPLTNYKRAI